VNKYKLLYCMKISRSS